MDRLVRPAGINSVHKFSSTATAGTSSIRLGITEFRVAFKAKFIDRASGQSVFRQIVAEPAVSTSRRDSSLLSHGRARRA